MDAKNVAETYNNSKQNRQEGAKSGNSDKSGNSGNSGKSDKSGKSGKSGKGGPKSKTTNEIVHNRKCNNAAPRYIDKKGKPTTRKNYNSSSKCPYFN